MSDIPFNMIDEYEGAPLYLVGEHLPKSCTGCCFDKDREQIGGCGRATKFRCNSNQTICVRNLNDYKVAAVTHKLTGELP